MPRRPDVAATAEALRQVLARLAASLDGPPYNLVLHTAPLREQVDATYHWHWEIHPRLREIAGLELGTGLPVNPVSPEDAVEELLGRAEDADGGWHGLIGVTWGRGPAVFWPTSGAVQMTALRFPSRTEDLWSSTPLSLTFADRSAIPPRSDREQPP